jgi:hypothetical protein
MNTNNQPVSPVHSLKVIQTPFCGELRSKKFYMLDQIATSAEDYIDNSGHMFCYLTQIPVGHDGAYVAPEVCGPGRQCYRSALEKPKPFVAGKSESGYD